MVHIAELMHYFKSVAGTGLELLAVENVQNASSRNLAYIVG